MKKKNWAKNLKKEVKVIHDTEQLRQSVEDCKKLRQLQLTLFHIAAILYF